MLVIVAVVAVAAAGIGFASGVVVGGGNASSPTEDPAPADTAAAEAVSGSPRAAPTGDRARDRRERRGDGANGLGIAPEEEAFVREALRNERERRRQAVILDTDGGIDIVRRAVEADADVTPLLADAEAARARILPSTANAVRFDAPDGRLEVDLKTLPADATVIEFGPGRFALVRCSPQKQRRRGEKDNQEIRGPGKDNTLLV